ncbi:aminotransferase class I/II-fold pyridoxal phosphate-dependent enzyme [Amycolatopsis sp. MtRt-6]|uniref:aminotransferase class I/II-fold pyridoxal phosphate-dependent enzyme n=1 Tax=Amycolatopsis sp. MtRt-6 TaxID=2792782 RepID=UPI001A8E7634|nr:aminotransferase class I/II-fold pyridoxal phosphate-dependent enzyme [Amycolatopsis sp. MtRt-6]
MDLFEKAVSRNEGLSALSGRTHGIATFPKLRGDIGSRMDFGGVTRLVWSLNNYLGLANHPEVRRADAEAALKYGLAAPMGSRMMSGETDDLEALETELAGFVRKPAAFFLNFGYQGMVSLVDILVGRHDWVVYDAHCHSCIIDGIRLSGAHARSFPHNDIGRLEKVLEQVERRRSQAEGVLVITEGVFGMSGDQGRLRDIVALKERFGFRFLVDDAHGFGIMGPDGRGTPEAQGVEDEVDLHFATFAKAGASIGAFVAGPADLIWYLRYTMRSQVFSKGLPAPIVAGNRTRLRVIESGGALRARCWSIAGALQNGLRAEGLDIGETASPVTPVFLRMTPEQALAYLELLREEFGIFCSAVTYPVVPPGVVQLRLIPTAEHTPDDVERTIEALPAAYAKITAESSSVCAGSAMDALTKSP